MALLCVNVDHVATVRQARGGAYPDPLEAALIAQRAGAAGITVHLREDRRHIQDHDVIRIRDAIRVKLNLEMAVTPSIIAFALAARPGQATFVPERRREVTTEGGLDLRKKRAAVADAIKRLQKSGVEVSLFIDPVEEQVRIARALGANAIEINTGAYAEAKSVRARNAELGRIKRAAKLSHRLGLVTHAGHGLNLENTGPIAAIPTLAELNIGHSIVSRAVIVGFAAAVREMRRAAGGARIERVR